MTQSARLITPEGETIELSAELYQRVRQLLTSRPRRRSRARIDKTIRETYGKYAGEPSLTRALLAERAIERAREEAKLARHHG